MSAGPLRLLAMAGSGSAVLATGSRDDVPSWRAGAASREGAGCTLVVESALGLREPLCTPRVLDADGAS